MGIGNPPILQVKEPSFREVSYALALSPQSGRDGTNIQKQDLSTQPPSPPSPHQKPKQRGQETTVLSLCASPLSEGLYLPCVLGPWASAGSR